MAQLVVGENSFISLSEANDIISNTYISISDERKFWDGLTDEDKSSLLIDATAKLNDERWMWVGKPVDDSQSLVFPRQNKENNEIIDINDRFKAGICRLVLFSCSTYISEYNKMLSSGVTSYKIKDCSISFDAETVRSSKGVINNNDDIPVVIFNNYFLPLTYLSF